MLKSQRLQRRPRRRPRRRRRGLLHDLLDLYRAVRAIEGIWHRVSISSQQWDILLQEQRLWQEDVFSPQTWPLCGGSTYPSRVYALRYSGYSCEVSRAYAREQMVLRL